MTLRSTPQSGQEPREVAGVAEWGQAWEARKPGPSTEWSGRGPPPPPHPLTCRQHRPPRPGADGGVRRGFCVRKTLHFMAALKYLFQVLSVLLFPPGSFAVRPEWSASTFSGRRCSSTCQS